MVLSEKEDRRCRGFMQLRSCVRLDPETLLCGALEKKTKQLYKCTNHCNRSTNKHSQKAYFDPERSITLDRSILLNI